MSKNLLLFCFALLVACTTCFAEPPEEPGNLTPGQSAARFQAVLKEFGHQIKTHEASMALSDLNMEIINLDSMIQNLQASGYPGPFPNLALYELSYDNIYDLYTMDLTSHSNIDTAMGNADALDPTDPTRESRYNDCEVDYLLGQDNMENVKDNAVARANQCRQEIATLLAAFYIWQAMN